ncbi:MAG: hypothetical protein AAF989_07030 [Planctomycetota bacterium]
MTEIRTFRNADLPGLLNVWIQHWSAVGQSPAVSVPMIEQSILSRTFFQAEHLLVAHSAGKVEAWAHFLPAIPNAGSQVPTRADVHEIAVQENAGPEIAGPETPGREMNGSTHAGSDSPASVADLPGDVSHEDAILTAVCFDPEGGLKICDELLARVEQAALQAGHRQFLTGPLRDDICGYAGLAPVGHGIGIPSCDTRLTSLLSRRGYVPERTTVSMSVASNTYRPPVNRESLQLRRSTRVESFQVYPRSAHQASAMAHLNMERHQLIEHRTGTVLAETGLWTSDPEAQVMDCSRGILDLSVPVRPPSDRTPADTLAESYLIGHVIQSSPNRRIFEIETSVDQDDTLRMSQLGDLKFSPTRQGQSWKKQLI